MKLFLCGDVMTGRGIDQIMAHASDPALFEPYMRSALDYVALAEDRSGQIPSKVPPDYVWGEALDDIERYRPDFRIINLETAVTDRGRPEPKGINYRMHPANAGCISAARIDCCVLANNHVLDWGADGLADTLSALQCSDIATAGAGADGDAAARPATLEATGRRLLVFAYAFPSSGVPDHWAAGAHRPGVNVLPDVGEGSLERLTEGIRQRRRAGDFVIVSLHWGPNWGYDIPERHRQFARNLIGHAGVDVVHGHSSHHPLAVEIYGGRPILYGCGDFINDYEAISGHESFRPNLALAYLITLDEQNHGLLTFEMLAYRREKFRLASASREEIAALAAIMDRECAPFGHRVRVKQGNVLTLSD